MLDVMMPKMSGFDLLKKMKSDPKLAGVPVVLLTNLAGKQDAQKGIELGAALYMIKSEHSPKQVVEKIEQLIQGSPQTPGGPPV
jgi:CheY-like chemotaxis protein